MPLIAKQLSSGTRINILEYEDPRNSLRKDDLVCPLCNEPVIIRAGLVKVQHFAHKKLCNSGYISHPESQEHLLAKVYLSKEIPRVFKEFSNAKVELEYPIKEVMRIADIGIILPNGWIIAHEIQLSSITTEQLNERTQDYLQAGVDVVWWLGKSAQSKENVNWCLENFGYCNTLDFKLHKTESIELLRRKSEL